MNPGDRVYHYCQPGRFGTVVRDCTPFWFEVKWDDTPKHWPAQTSSEFPDALRVVSAVELLATLARPRPGLLARVLARIGLA